METEVAMYAQFVAKDEIADFRFRLPDSLKQEWVEMCEAHKIGIQDSLVGVMRSVLEQNEVARSMLMRQLRPSGDLVQLVLQRLADAPKTALIEPDGSVTPVTHSRRRKS